MGITETADLVLELMFKWISEREACALELKKMAAELESLREKCNGGETVGSTVSVAGAACLLGAGVATLFTGGAAAPLIGLAGAYTGVGLTVSLTSNLIEHFSSSGTIKKAQKKEEESNTIAQKIKRQFEQLKEELMKLNPNMHPDDLDQQVMTAFMGAVGRHSGNSRVIRFLKDMSFGGGPSTGMMLQDKQGLLIKVASVGMISILTFFAFQLSGKKYKLLFAKATEQLVKTMSSAALKTALKRGAMAVGGAVCLAFALPEAIDNWKKMIKNNHVTEASKSLRDTASDILEMTRNLKEQLDNIRKELDKLADMKQCIENTDRSLEDQRRLIQYAIEYCNDELVRQWLMDMSAQNVFFGLLDMFNFLKNQLSQEWEKKKIDISDIDITFVAHGAIEETTMLANCLVPLPSIKDVLLYSPWNCLLTADAAYGIATGRIQPHHREFIRVLDDQPVQTVTYNLPPYWNSMRRSGCAMIPDITVSSLTPEDGAWKCFQLLQTEHGEPGRNRVVLPFLFPYHVEVPFYIVTLALSLVLLFSCFRATVHLAACLGKASPRTRLNVWQLMEQYAYTEDDTAMTTSQVMLEERFSDLYRALKSVFDKTPTPRS